MAQPIDPIVIRGLHRGMADRSVLADSLMPSSQMRLVVNMDPDAIGYLTGRKGYERLGSTSVVSDTAGEGLLQHDGTNSQIIAFISGAAYYLSGSTWTDSSLGFTPGNKIRAVSFLDRVFAVNGVDSPKSWNGSTVWDTTNLSGAPTGALIATYKQQMFIGNTSTDRIDFSSVPDSGGTTITWPSGNSFILNPNDGTNITAMTRFGKEMLFSKVGKAGSFMYRFNGRSTDADPVIYYGAASQEALYVSGSVMWFYDPVKHAILAYQGGFPYAVSKPIRAFLRAIPTSNNTNVCLWGDDDHVEAYIGDVTVDGVPFTNVSCRYGISSKVWTLRSYANEFRAFSDYDDGTDFFHLGFTTDGNVVKMDTGNDDMGSAINYDLQTAWMVLGGNPAVHQKLAAFSVFVENARSMSVFYKTDLDPTWRPIGQVSSYVNSWSGINARFHKIKFRFTGSNTGEPAIFDGFSLLTPLIEGIEKTTEK